jgi:hypothetical protein
MLFEAPTKVFHQLQRNQQGKAFHDVDALLQGKHT